jgi:transposase
LISTEEVMEVKVMARQGASIRQIAKQTQLSRNTVRRYLREPMAAVRQPAPIRANKLDCFKAYIADRIEAARPHWIPATVMLRELQALGYKGQITLLRMFMFTLKPAAKADPVVRFETDLGEQMQCDWIVFRRGKSPLSAFVATLGACRASFVRFVTDERLPNLIRSHEEAFEFFGGVPRHVLYDNMKTVVVNRDAYGEGQHQFQSTFLDFAGHYGFLPRLCRPYRAKTKGKVERFNGYLRRSFYNPLASHIKQVSGGELLLDADTANFKVRIWLRDVANARVHGTTSLVPAEELMIEQPLLLPLPPPYVGVIKPAPPFNPSSVWQQPMSTQPLQHNLSVYDAFCVDEEDLTQEASLMTPSLVTPSLMELHP